MASCFHKLLLPVPEFTKSGLSLSRITVLLITLCVHKIKILRYIIKIWPGSCYRGWGQGWGVSECFSILLQEPRLAKKKSHSSDSCGARKKKIHFTSVVTLRGVRVRQVLNFCNLYSGCRHIPPKTTETLYSSLKCDVKMTRPQPPRD